MLNTQADKKRELYLLNLEGEPKPSAGIFRREVLDRGGAPFAGRPILRICFERGGSPSGFPSPWRGSGHNAERLARTPARMGARRWRAPGGRRSDRNLLHSS